MDHKYMALLMFSIVVMSLRGGGMQNRQGPAWTKRRQRREGSFMLTDDRLKVTDEKADDHRDMIIRMIITLILMRNTLLIFGDLSTLQMITYCVETGNRKQGWAWT